MPSVNARPTWVRYLVLVWLCLAAVVAYLERSALAVPASAIQRDLNLDSGQMGVLMSLFFWAYALAQIPAGWLGQRWGTRRGLTIFVAVGAYAMFMIASGRFQVMCLGLFLLGVAQAGMFPCCVTSFRDWFPPLQRSLPSGMLTASMSLGSVAAAALAGALVASLGWRGLLLWFALPGVVWSVGFGLWFRNRPREHSWVNAAECELIEADTPPHAPVAEAALSESEASSSLSATAGSHRPAWQVMLSSGRMWLVCLQHLFRAAGVVFYQTWFPTYLREARGMSLEQSGYFTALPMLGLVLGSLAGGVASDAIQRLTGDRRHSRRGLALVSTLGCAAFFAMALAVESPVSAVCLIACGALLAGMSSPIAYTITIDLGGPHVATMFSTMNMAGNIGGALCPAVVGWFVNAWGWPPVPWLFAGIYLASAVCWLGLDPRGSLFPARE